MLLPLDLLLPLLLGPLSTATTSGRWPALDTNQPTNQRIGPPLRPVLTPTLAPNPNQDTLLVSLHFGGRTQKVRIAADGSTDALYAAAMQVYALHGQRVALSVRGVPLPEGVPVQQEVGLVLAAARDDAVLVTAAPQLTVQEIYGLPVGDAGSVEGTRDGAKGVGGAGGAEGTRDGAGGAGGGSERGSEQGGRSSVDEGGRDLASAFARKLGKIGKMGKLGRSGEAKGGGEAAAGRERRTNMFGSPDKASAARAARAAVAARAAKARDAGQHSTSQPGEEENLSGAVGEGGGLGEGAGHGELVSKGQLAPQADLALARVRAGRNSREDQQARRTAEQQKAYAKYRQRRRSSSVRHGDAPRNRNVPVDPNVRIGEIDDIEDFAPPKPPSLGSDPGFY